MCVHAPHTHTHIWKTAKLSNKTHKHWIHLHYLILFLATFQHRTTTCTTKPTLESLSDPATEVSPRMRIVLMSHSFPNPKVAELSRTSFPETNTGHHANHELSRICEPNMIPLYWKLLNNTSGPLRPAIPWPHEKLVVNIVSTLTYKAPELQVGMKFVWQLRATLSRN